MTSSIKKKGLGPPFKRNSNEVNGNVHKRKNKIIPDTRHLMKPEHLKSYFGSEKYKMVEFLGGMKEKSQAEENIDEEDKAQHALRN
jgi:hypothetical protein